MNLILDCPRAEYREGMRIYCRATGDLCAHQRFKPCKGWCVLTDGAKRCPARKGDERGAKPSAAPNGGD